MVPILLLRVYFTPYILYVFLDLIVTESVKIVSETSEANEVSRDRIKVQASLQILRFQNGVTDAQRPCFNLKSRGRKTFFRFVFLRNLFPVVLTPADL